MTCGPGDAVPQPVGVELLTPWTDGEMLAMVTATREAYGEPTTPTADDALGVRALLAAGGLAVLARDAVTGEPAGGGDRHRDRRRGHGARGVRPPALAGREVPPVRERWRRRGIAGAITGHLVETAFAEGAETVFLTPGGDEAERVYARAGFRGRAEVLHISRPSR
jgi:GNAT superfamily N-acetyltransferase